ncbi:hypothetical protein BaRGS_00009511, partial [Batillaria attramentaria]
QWQLIASLFAAGFWTLHGRSGTLKGYDRGTMRGQLAGVQSCYRKEFAWLDAADQHKEGVKCLHRSSARTALRCVVLEPRSRELSRG